VAGVWADNFGWYTSAQLLRYYTQKVEVGAIAVGPYGRSAGSALRFSGSLSDTVRSLNVSTISGTTAIEQADLRISAYPSGGNVILAFYDGASIQCSLDLQPDGTLRAYRGFAGTKTALGPASAYVVPLSQHIHLGVKAVIGNSGSVVVHVWEDGDSAAHVVLNLSSVDTQDTASAQWNGFEIGAACDGMTDWSNLVVMDGSGTYNNDLLGPADVFARLPIADGAHRDLTPSTGLTQYGPIGDAVADDDITHLDATDVDQRTTVVVQPAPFSDRVVAFSVLVHVSRGEGAALAPVARQDGVDTLGSDVALDAAFLAYPTPYNTAPDATPWTPAIWNAMEWGIDS
jgi:hypothetical protein